MFFFLGYGLKCYQCVTLKDWDDCDNTKKEVTCADGENYCEKAYATGKHGGVSVSVYRKGCSSSSDCDTAKSEVCNPSDPTVSVAECEINCCSGYLCNEAKVPKGAKVLNGAKVPMVSAIMLLACVSFPSLSIQRC